MLFPTFLLVIYLLYPLYAEYSSVQIHLEGVYSFLGDGVEPPALTYIERNGKYGTSYHISFAALFYS